MLQDGAKDPYVQVRILDDEKLSDQAIDVHALRPARRPRGGHEPLDDHRQQERQIVKRRDARQPGQQVMAKRKGISLDLPLDGELDAVTADREESDDPVDAGSHYIEQKVVKPSGKPAGNLGVDHP